MKKTITFLSLSLIILIAICAYSYKKKDVSFVVMGDMPCCKKEQPMLTLPDGKLTSAIKSLNVPVMVHYGDFMSGGESCTDELYKKRRAQIFAINPHRIIYVPGDNEWTDCDRKYHKESFSELERLDRLKTLFYKDKNFDFSKNIPNLVRQKEQIENSMWKIGNLLMGTLHIVGTHNGRINIMKDDINNSLDAVDRRDANNMQWLERLFNNAKDASGLVIVFHADIYNFKKNLPACTKEKRQKCDPYKNIRNRIEELASTYQKPVLVIHGDTNAYCFNHLNKKITNLWHFNGPGDYKVSDAGYITFHENNTSNPFEVRGVLNRSTPPKVCDYRR